MEDYYDINEKELMAHYGFNGLFGKIQLKCKLIKTWFLHRLAYSSPNSKFIVRLQRSRGVKIGENCHVSPYVLLDLVYPELISIENNVTIGSNVMIFAHVNPTANIWLKKNVFPRKIGEVTIKSGAVINPGAIITSGVTIGKNSIVSVGSVVGENIPDNCVVVGNPARIVKKIEVDEKNDKEK